MSLEPCGRHFVKLFVEDQVQQVTFVADVVEERAHGKVGVSRDPLQSRGVVTEFNKECSRRRNDSPDAVESCSLSNADPRTLVEW